MKLGLIREGKNPPDKRVVFTPIQCKELLEQYPEIDLVVQSSPNRCFPDADYKEQGIKVVEDVSDRAVLMGVKEVPIEQLIPNKTYFFFSHTIKKQPYNRDLLRAVLDKNIRLIDYERLTNDDNERLIGFGRHAGIVGAHNGVKIYGKKTGAFSLPDAHSSTDFNELKEVYKKTKFSNFKVVNTGNGKVAYGAIETLKAMGIKEVNKEDFSLNSFDYPVYTHLKYADMYRHFQHHEFDKDDFYRNPSHYYADFKPFYQNADIFINGIFWANDGPVYFTNEDMRQEDFNIKVIADVTCDIAPLSSVPCTLRATVIGDDVMGYDPITEKEVPPYGENTIEVMSVDNLPNELPRDAATEFGKVMTSVIIPELLKVTESMVLKRASIAQNGQLTEPYFYLSDYVS